MVGRSTNNGFVNCEKSLFALRGMMCVTKDCADPKGTPFAHMAACINLHFHDIAKIKTM